MANCSENLYVISYTDVDKGTITIAKSSLVSSDVDITLVGKTRREYGEIFNENLLHLLEGFACPEDSSDVGNPDLTVAFGTLLTNPVQGQRWFNSTTQTTYVFDGSDWLPIASDEDVAGVSGVIADGASLPHPISKRGYEFPYSECTWVVSPFSFIADDGVSDEIDYMHCYATTAAVVHMKYRNVGESSLRSGYANYMILGIKGNTNFGALETVPYVVPSPTPNITPTPTPTISLSASVVPPTPSPSPTISVTPSITPSITPSRSFNSSPTPTPTRSPTATPTKTPTPTPTKTPTPTPTRSPTPTPSSAQLIAAISFTSGCTPTLGCCNAGLIVYGSPKTIEVAAVVTGQGTADLTYTWEYLNSTAYGPSATIEETTEGNAEIVVTSPFGALDDVSSFGSANFRLTVEADDGRIDTVDFCISGTTRGGSYSGAGGGGGDDFTDSEGPGEFE